MPLRTVLIRAAQPWAAEPKDKENKYRTAVLPKSLSSVPREKDECGIYHDSNTATTAVRRGIHAATGNWSVAALGRRMMPWQLGASAEID
jgi:hypothetical protein